jgi:hypothetical protein
VSLPQTGFTRAKMVTEVSTSFLKKRSKRLLFLRSFKPSGHVPYLSAGAETRVSWFFSSEKNTLALAAHKKGRAIRARPPFNPDVERNNQSSLSCPTCSDIFFISTSGGSTLLSPG